MTAITLEKFEESVASLCVAMRAFPSINRLDNLLKFVNETVIEEPGIDDETRDTYRQKAYYSFLRGHILYNGVEYSKTDMGKLMILSFDESTGLNPIAIFTNNINRHISEMNGEVLPEMKAFIDVHHTYLIEHYSRL